MKKTTFAVGSAALIAEFVLFISFCKLTESSNYYWIGAGVAGLLAMITVYFICAKFTELLVDVYSEHLKKVFENKNDIIDLCDKYLETIDTDIDEIHQSVNELTTMQQKMLEDNSRFCADLHNTLETVVATNCECVDKLTAEVESECGILQKHMEKLATMHKELIDNNNRLVKELNGAVRALSLTVENNINNSDSLFSKSAEMSENSYKRICDLADIMCKYNDDVKNFRKDVVDVNKMMKETINRGIDDFSVKYGEFNNELNDTIDSKLGEYNEKFDTLSQNINELIKVCDTNAKSYKDSLDFISRSQTESNSLTKEDIKLLQQLLKR